MIQEHTPLETLLPALPALLVLILSMLVHINAPTVQLVLLLLQLVHPLAALVPLDTLPTPLEAPNVLLAPLATSVTPVLPLLTAFLAVLCTTPEETDGLYVLHAHMVHTTPTLDHPHALNALAAASVDAKALKLF